MFDVELKSIDEVFTKSHFDIPRNQRKYVWNKKNWDALISDIDFSVKSLKEHFIGSIVLQEKEKINNLKYYWIIDGQQRLITVTMLLIAIMFKLRIMNEEDDAKGIKELLFPKDSKSKSRFILDEEYYNVMSEISQFEPKRDNDLIKLFNDIRYKNEKSCIGIKYFYEKIKENGITDFLKYLYQIRCIKIIAKNDEDAYTIFEILNARGVDLNEAEKVKNYILRYILPKENVDIAKKKWDDMERRLSTYINKFIVHYIQHKFVLDDAEKKDIFFAYKSKFEKDKITEIFDDIVKKSFYYEKMCNPIRYDINNLEICSEIEYKIFRFLKSKRHEIFRPLLLSIMNLKENDNLEKEEYEKHLIYLYNFFVIFTLIGRERSNLLADIINKYSSKIENSLDKEILKETCDKLKDKIPNGDWMINLFNTIRYSHVYSAYSNEMDKHNVQMILSIYEGYLRKEFYIDDNFTIEHIVDDNLSEDNSIIGNLLPLEDDLNKQCIGKKFEEKLNIYSKSKYFTTKQFSKRYSKLEDFDMNKRTKYLCNEIFNKVLVV